MIKAARSAVRAQQRGALIMNPEKQRGKWKQLPSLLGQVLYVFIKEGGIC